MIFKKYKLNKQLKMRNINKSSFLVLEHSMAVV